MTNTRVIACGSGNGAHALAVLCGHYAPDFQVRILKTQNKPKLKIWQDYIENETMKLTSIMPDGSPQTLHANPFMLTHSAEAAFDLPNATAETRFIIIFMVPAFAHEEIFQEIIPFIRKTVTEVGSTVAVVGMPGGAGFEMQAAFMMGHELYNKCIISNFCSTPWVVRLEEFAKSVHISGYKELFWGVSKINSEEESRVAKEIEADIQRVFGPFPKVDMVNNGHILLGTFEYLNLNIHPIIVYSEWKDWNDNSPHRDEPPAFYSNMSKWTSNEMSALNNELIQLWEEVQKREAKLRGKGKCIPLEEILALQYPAQMQSCTDLQQQFTTFRGYLGIKHICEKDPITKKYKPKFDIRHLTEDIPFGLCPIKGIAELVNMETPIMDFYLKWGQEKIGKTYIIDGKFVGPDILETRAPQAFGHKSLSDIVQC